MSEETRIGEFVTIRRQDGFAEVAFDRGDGRNALSRQAILELTEAARSFADDLETQAVILWGKDAFTAGADLKDPAIATWALRVYLVKKRMQMSLQSKGSNHVHQPL